MGFGRKTFGTALWLIAVWTGCVAAEDEIRPRDGLAPVTARLEALIRRVMKDQDLPAVSIALVEGRRVTWAKGFGLARPKEGVAATADTVYRVGSVSKIFTDLALMQLVEKGSVDLDAPVSRYLPDFTPGNRSGMPITLRQNGETKQQARTSQMIYAVAEIVSFASQSLTLLPGDVILTGTPSGVGPIRAGDVLEAQIGDWPPLRNTVVNARHATEK